MGKYSFVLSVFNNVLKYNNIYDFKYRFSDLLISE